MLSNELTIIVVTYNSMDILPHFLVHLKNALQDEQCEIIISDNCSSDDIQNYINRYHPDVHLVKLKENMGYGAALNEGIKIAKTPYVALMNPDVIVEPGGFNELIIFLKEHPEAAAVSGLIAHCTEIPKSLTINSLFPDKKVAANIKYENLFSRIVYYTGLRYKLPKAKFLKSWKMVKIKDYIEVTRLEGSFGIFRREALLKAGLFDPRLFLYFEEDDIAIRLKKFNYKIYITNRTVIAHVHGKGSNLSRSIVSEKILLNSTYLFFRKYYGLAYAWISFFTIWTIISIILLLKILLKKDHYTLMELWKWHFYSLLLKGKTPKNTIPNNSSINYDWSTKIKTNN